MRALSRSSAGALKMGLILAALAGGPAGAQDWERAEREIERLPPAAFVGLAPAVRADLERRGCLVPQSYLKRSPHNVIRGRFTSAGTVDTAVLCSTSGASAILVYPTGSLDGVHELAPQRDRDYLQTIDTAGRIGYSRALEVATPDYLRRQHQRYGGPRPPELDHEGIEDQFLEKASGIWYWHQRRCLRLQGTD